MSAPLHPVLAIDHGDARIGLAATDDLGIAAHPVETIEVRKVDALERLAEIIAAAWIAGPHGRVGGTVR